MNFKRSSLFLIIFFFCLELAAIADEGQKNPNYSILKNTKAPISSIKVINIFSHDAKAFTQGLLYYNGYLYESTGLNGKSALRKVNIKSGKVVLIRSISRLFEKLMFMMETLQSAISMNWNLSVEKYGLIFSWKMSLSGFLR